MVYFGDVSGLTGFFKTMLRARLINILWFKAQMPVYGPLFSKIEGFGDQEQQYDLCGTDFNKLPPAEQALYYMTLRPGANPIKVIDTSEHIESKRKHAGVVKSLETACEITVDPSLPGPMRTVMEVCQLRTPFRSSTILPSMMKAPVLSMRTPALAPPSLLVY